MICICCGGAIRGVGGYCNGCRGVPTPNTAPPAHACAHTVPVVVPGWPAPKAGA